MKPSRESQLRGRLRLAQLAERNEAIDDEMGLQRSRFARLAKKESSPVVVSSFNLFQTPEPLAARVVEILGRTGRTLEPSAGLGRLYRAIRAVDPESPVTLVEQSPDCCGVLYHETESDGNCRLVQGDFLAQTTDSLGLFDCVIMNPPFRMNADSRHILHAAKFLKDGGRLVSICAAGPRQRKTLGPVVSQWIDLPARSFASEGTSVEAAIIVIDR